MDYEWQVKGILFDIKELYGDHNVSEINVDWKTERVTNHDVNSSELMETVALPMVQIKFRA